MSGYEETPVHLEYMRYYDKLNGVNRGAKPERLSKERIEGILKGRAGVLGPGSSFRVGHGCPSLFVTITGFIVRISDLRLV